MYVLPSRSSAVSRSVTRQRSTHPGGRAGGREHSSVTRHPSRSEGMAFITQQARLFHPRRPPPPWPCGGSSGARAGGCRCPRSQRSCRQTTENGRQLLWCKRIQTSLETVRRGSKTSMTQSSSTRRDGVPLPSLVGSPLAAVPPPL